MQNILNTKFYLGSKADYLNSSFNDKEWAFVHIGTELFTQHTKGKNTDLIVDESHLYLNWQDLPKSKKFDINILREVFDFIDANQDRNIYIHCDYGQSRSPTILMTYLAKRTDKLPNNFHSAVEKFSKIYPDYFYLSGIAKFVKQEWEKIT